jgi:hypothetical protein
LVVAGGVDGQLAEDLAGGGVDDADVEVVDEPADRLDRVPLGALVVDEGDDQRLRGSSSPAKKIEAAFKISLSSRSRRFSALGRLISSASAP